MDWLVVIIILKNNPTKKWVEWNIRKENHAEYVVRLKYMRHLYNKDFNRIFIIYICERELAL